MIRKLAVFTLMVISLAMRVEASEIPVNHVKEKIVKHSVEMGIDPALALSLAKAESGYVHASRSSHGAIGVFQLMPGTAKKMGVNPYHLDGNIRGGLMYYKMLYKMFGSQELALAAYHTGPAYVVKHRCPAPCSRRYIAGIMKEYYRLKAHTDPAILRHNARTEQLKRQKAKADFNIDSDAKAKERAKVESDNSKNIVSENKSNQSVTDEIVKQANDILEASAQIKDYLSSAM